MKQNIIPFIQRAMEISGHLSLPNLSNSVRVAKLRYIQTVARPQSAWLGRNSLSWAAKPGSH
jgi:hypothetical protein